MYIYSFLLGIFVFLFIIEEGKTWSFSKLFMNKQMLNHNAFMLLKIIPKIQLFGIRTLSRIPVTERSGVEKRSFRW